jgi:hypothetical protein
MGEADTKRSSDPSKAFLVAICFRGFNASLLQELVLKNTQQQPRNFQPSFFEAAKFKIFEPEFSAFFYPKYSGNSSISFSQVTSPKRFFFFSKQSWKWRWQAVSKK